jgi:hypothetical protein
VGRARRPAGLATPRRFSSIPFVLSSQLRVGSNSRT